jgi:hypothetical protein
MIEKHNRQRLRIDRAGLVAIPLRDRLGLSCASNLESLLIPSGINWRDHKPGWAMVKASVNPLGLQTRIPASKSQKKPTRGSEWALFCEC